MKPYLLLLILCVLSCSNPSDYDTFKKVSKSKWNINEPISFAIDNKDTIQRKNIFIQLRNNNDYPFSNLFLITDMTFPKGKRIVDTLEYTMARPDGTFLGSGATDIKENLLVYKENVILPEEGTYHFEIRHAMRKLGEEAGVTFLDGVLDVGLKITPVSKK